MPSAYFPRVVFLFGVFVSPAFAGIPSDSARETHADRLTGLRAKVIELEKGLISGLKSQRAVRGNLDKMRQLIGLQKEERDLGRTRMEELQKTVVELEARRLELLKRIQAHQASIRRSLVAIERSSQANIIRPGGSSLNLPELEKLEAPRRRALINLVDRGFKEIEAFKVDLSDADNLEQRIQEEKQQLTYLFQDLKEQESVLELNHQLQEDLLRRKHDERLAQLENYRRLKSAEAQVERLISEFNARRELERVVETERIASKAMIRGAFAASRGKLPLPVNDGKIVSKFGRFFDGKSRLYVFKKGVDIAAGKKVSVRAISAGKVAFSGELPDYGRVTIIDHGEHFYSLCARLGELSRTIGDAVAVGDPIGSTDDLGTPVYFEIRARNVAVNPLQWVSN